MTQDPHLLHHDTTSIIMTPHDTTSIITTSHGTQRPRTPLNFFTHLMSFEGYPTTTNKLVAFQKADALVLQLPLTPPPNVPQSHESPEIGKQVQECANANTHMAVAKHAALDAHSATLGVLDEARPRTRTHAMQIAHTHLFEDSRPADSQHVESVVGGAEAQCSLAVPYFAPTCWPESAGSAGASVNKGLTSQSLDVGAHTGEGGAGKEELCDWFSLERMASLLVYVTRWVRYIYVRRWRLGPALLLVVWAVHCAVRVFARMQRDVTRLKRVAAQERAHVLVLQQLVLKRRRR